MSPATLSWARGHAEPIFRAGQNKLESTMLEQLLIALRLKKAKKKPTLPIIEPLTPWPRCANVRHAPPRLTPPLPPLLVRQFAAAPTSAPADSHDADMMNLLFLQRTLNSGHTRPPHLCTSEQDAEPLRAGGGDFGGAGASGLWEPPPAPSCEPPTPGSGYGSGSCDGGSYGGYSSD